MKYVYGGPVIALGRFGTVQTGGVVDFNPFEASQAELNPNFAPVPAPTRIEKRLNYGTYNLSLEDFGKLIRLNYPLGSNISTANVILPSNASLGWYVECVDDSVAQGLGLSTNVTPSIGTLFTDWASQTIHARTGDRNTNVSQLGPGSPGKFAVEPINAGDIVFLHGQTNKAENGLYIVPISATDLGPALRHPGADSWSELSGLMVVVDHGDNDNFFNDGDGYLQTMGGQIVVGATPLTFAPIFDGNYPANRMLTWQRPRMGAYWNGAGWTAF